MSDTVRCASYARYSTDRQNPLSAEDQIRKCREHAQNQNWLVLEDHIYRDEALSGTSDDRPGLRRLLAAALLQPRPFDVLLIDDIYTTGAKARACSTALKKGGAARVWVATVARAQRQEIQFAPSSNTATEPPMHEDIAMWDGAMSDGGKAKR